MDLERTHGNRDALGCCRFSQAIADNLLCSIRRFDLEVHALSVSVFRVPRCSRASELSIVVSDCIRYLINEFAATNDCLIDGNSDFQIERAPFVVINAWKPHSCTADLIMTVEISTLVSELEE
jgi:hypothetical protein